MKTPLHPKLYEASIALFDAEDTLIAIGAPPEIDNGDMAEIARRVNAYPALAEALEPFAVLASAVARTKWPGYRIVFEFDGAGLSVRDLERAVEALALAKGAE